MQYTIHNAIQQDERSPQQAIAESLTPATVESQIYHSAVRRSTNVLTQQQESVRKKHNLTKWKYAELRDTINTSVGQFRMLALTPSCLYK